MVTDDKFQEIIDKTDIVSLVSEYVELTKKGNGYFGLCPFHDDSSPSFSVSADKKIAKCMSCGEGGNPITFLKKIKKISTTEAISILAQRAGVEVDLKLAPKKEDKNQKYYNIYKVAQEFYSYNLFNSKSGKKALEYLYKRGLTEETIKMFGIGLAPNTKDTLTKVLIDNNFLDIDCIEIGLIKNNGTNLYDIFMNRIMFPITNENGQTIAFSGRLFDDSNGPKYVNTMETAIYRKGDHLYNLSNAISQINKTKRIILCEGQMDVIKISNSNLKDVVCALGSALTTNQVKLIKKYATNVVLAYDNDNAGIKATKTAINLLKGLNIDVLQLPSGVDPDEYINTHSIEKFHELFDKKVNSIEFIYNSYFIDKNIYSLAHVEEIKNDVFRYIKTLSSNTVKEQLFNKLSSDLKINYENLLKDYNLMNGIKVSPKNVQRQNNNYNQNNYNNYQNNIPPVSAYEPPPADIIYDMPPDDYGYNQAPPEIYEYVPDAPPQSFGDVIHYDDMDTPNVVKPKVVQQPVYQNRPIPQNKVYNNYNQNNAQLNVGNNANGKKTNKALEDACKTVIALCIYSHALFIKTKELLNGEDLDLYLPSPFDDYYSELVYIHGKFSDLKVTDIHGVFNKELKKEKVYDEIITILNTIKPESNTRKILSDGINYIMKCFVQAENKKKIELAKTEAQKIDGMNEVLSIRKEQEKIK